MEECDFWSGTWPSWCSNSCQIWDLTSSVPWTWEITIPDWWSISFGPNDSIVIWAWMNPYTTYSIRPYITNSSDYDLYFDYLCAVRSTWTTLLWSTVCDSLWIIWAWETRYLTTPNIVWSQIVSWDYANNVLVTTLRHNSNTYKDAYFVSNLNVRVAGATIATIWWWTSYVSDTSDVADVSEIAEWIEWLGDNKNFVWVWVSDWNISSYTNEINDTDDIESVANEVEKYSDSLDQVSNETGTAFTSTSNIWEFENYNWMDNVFILRNTNFTVNNILSWESWAKTYVIENWDLIIESNIEYNDNIAFVVKWWNIIIDRNVSRIDWTYISIQNGTEWWNFKWNGTTTDILIVNGSLYWNINELIATRTFVKQNPTGQLDVWTIVSFWSSLFRETAPLVSTFINEYLSSEKIAQ